ncbi:MAG TPA: LysR family transcriptional regulator [Vicinamibacterales bacterium]|nr:LysR family transcriptional regulator [Vicinamibacterales bacterium]
MQLNDLNVLAAFLAVAQERSFTRAATRVGVSRSALSHAVRGLEERIGVRLLARTTRSVAPTDAGEQLIARLGPALMDVNSVLDQIAGLSDRPSGRVRVVASRLAARMILAPKMARFAREHPDVVLDLTTTEESRVDLVREGFDAGIHLGEFVERDMVAVRVSKEQRAAIVGAPAYFAAHPKPKTPRDLTTHRCLNFRHGASGVYRWEFEKGPKSLAVAVNGPIIVDDVDVLIHAAVAGAGLAFTLEDHVAPQFAEGALVRVLENWCPPFAGYFLYYPSRRQQRAAVSALIDTLRL